MGIGPLLFILRVKGALEDVGGLNRVPFKGHPRRAPLKVLQGFMFRV